MIVSTKGRYALRVMIDLAEHQAEGYIPLREVSERQAISEKYLESIVKTLVQNKLLQGLRGKGGGYKLTRKPEQYTVYDILSLTEGTLAPVSCLEEGAAICPTAGQCRTLPMWQELNTLVGDFFKGYTLADLMVSASSGDFYVI